jgi:hypothetical protein
MESQIQSTHLQLPILSLLHPRRRTVLLIGALAAALLLWSYMVWRAGMPVWGATTLALAVLLPVAMLKWRDDLQRWGSAVAVLSALVVMQGFHTIEHLVQLIQYHLLKWPPFASSGLISAANAEWVHFLWNWTLVIGFVYLIRQGMRSPWAWILLIWSTAHSLEHTYLLVRYFEAVAELQRLGIQNLGLAQGLPGILGRDGWLAYSDICGRIPGLTTAVRIDVHFWWNAGEIVLLMLAAHPFLKERLRIGD